MKLLSFKGQISLLNFIHLLFNFGCTGYLHCCTGFSLVATSQGYSLVPGFGLIVVDLLVAEHRV